MKNLLIKHRVSGLLPSMLMALAMAGPGAAQVIYDSIPHPTPPNVPSLGYQANQTDEFGDLIQFAGTSRTLTKVTVLMSDWAPASDWPAYPGASGPTWNHPLTLNLYTVVPNANPNLNPAPGTLIATRTQTFAIPWRPPTDPTCPNPNTWRASDGLCYSGFAFTVTFDFTGVVVPNQIIYGLAYNTETWGANPIGVGGPYDSLNFGLSDSGASIGTQPNPDSAYWNTHTPGNYSFDQGINSIFRKDVNWTPYSGAITFDTTPVTPVDAYLVSYASNLVAGDSVVNFTNTGVVNGFDPAGGICANVYTFDPSEELVSCCSCYITPDGLKSVSAKQDLVSNTLTPGVAGSVVIKILASAPTAPATCNAAGTLVLEPGLRAWGTSLHQNTSTGNFEITENVFQTSPLSVSELSKLTTYCGFIQANGSGFGICKSCRLGGLGGAQR